MQGHDERQSAPIGEARNLHAGVGKMRVYGYHVPFTDQPIQKRRSAEKP
jgi:hypothetical protein